MAVKQFNIKKVNPADLKDCMSKQKGMPPFIARAKCLKQLSGKK